MTKIPKQQTTWSALDFLENSEQETNAQKSELERRAELRRKLAAEQAKKESSITTANDKQDQEIQARREKARKEVQNRTNYEKEQQRILSQNRPLMSGQLSGTQDFIGYMLPGYSTLMFADDASKHSQLVGSAIKNRQWGAAAGNAIKVPADIAMGAISLIPFAGAAVKGGNKLVQETQKAISSIKSRYPLAENSSHWKFNSGLSSKQQQALNEEVARAFYEADGRFVLREPQPFQYLEDGTVKEWSTPSITKQSPITRSSISRTEYSKGTTDPVKLAEIKQEFLKNNPGLTIIDNGIIEQIRIPEDQKQLTTNMISRIENFGRDLDKSGVKYYDPKTEQYITTSYRDYVNNVIPDYIQLELPKDSYTAGLNGYFTRQLGGNTNATLVTNPFNSDIYSTIFHEGSMHPTEDAIMRIPIPNHPQGKTIGDLYQSVAYPSDIIDSKILDSLIKNTDSTLDVEARATNGEVFRKINQAIAKATGKPITEISKDKELFEKLVEKNWGTLETEEDLVKLGNLLRTTPGGYVDDYYRILTSDKIPFETRQRYAKRVLYMIKKLPVFAAPVTVADQMVFQEKLGGKLNYLKYIN